MSNFGPSMTPACRPVQNSWRRPRRNCAPSTISAPAFRNCGPRLPPISIWLAPNLHHLPRHPRKTPINSPLLATAHVLVEDEGNIANPHKMGVFRIPGGTKTGLKGHFRGTDLHQIRTTRVGEISGC